MQDRRDLQAELQRLVETLRANHPDAVLSTRVDHADERAVIAHASIVAGDGRSSSGLGSAPAEDGAAELAENRAISRALIAIGLPVPAEEPAKLTGPTAVEPPGRVVQFPTHEADQPSGPDQPAPSSRTGRPETAPSTRAAQPPAGASPARGPQAAPPTGSASAPAAPSGGASGAAPAASPRATSSPPTPPPAAVAPPVAQAGADDDPDAADLSWTAFWKWAREHGFSNKMALEEALGGTLGPRSPGEVRKLMREQLEIDG